MIVSPSVVPCLGKIVDRISDAAVDRLFHGFNYLFCYKDGVQDLIFKIEQLGNEEDKVSRKANAEKDNGKIINADVLQWQTDVEQVQKTGREFSEKYKNRSSWRCIRCLRIPNPVSRFQLGREAQHMAKQVTALVDSGREYLGNEIAYLSQGENAPTTDTVYQNFESRNEAYDKLWEALLAEGGSCLILGIYGMPGVGKTRMMEHIWNQSRDKKIFDKVTRADVGNEKLDIIKLQNQIGGHLNCNFESPDNEVLRASQLKNSLTSGKKVLVVLDDVWDYIPLQRIGIPFGDGRISSRGCKILITSRHEDVCRNNRCIDPVKITPLTKNEAWDLFRNTVGIESLEDDSLAQKVCEKCAGLPLLIHAVAKTLQFATRHEWKDALDQLENGKVENILNLDRQVYACVELSINRLQPDAKSCLFLCSLYPEDADISIRKLIQLATGSRLVTSENRVCAVVYHLKSSSLLLDSQKDHVIKLHDLIRDVARSMAFEQPVYAFLLVRCGSRLPDDSDYTTRKLLHIHLDKSDCGFPDGLVCPDLRNLWLQCNKHIQQFSSGFFAMFVNLRFLLIEDMLSSSERKFSLQPLGNLRTLILDGCDMRYIDQTNDSFFPEDLETLCIWNCHLQVPLYLPNLKHLRKLEIQGWRGISVQMVPNTISSMPSLEELHIPGGFSIAGSEIIVDAISAPALVEISKLTRLKSLQMLFIQISQHFQDTDIFNNLLEFNVCVGPGRDIRYFLDSSVSFKRSIELNGIELEALNSLIETAENVKLECTHINMSGIYNSNEKALTDLRNLYIRECNTMGHLASTTQDVIQQCLQKRTSFSNLTILTIIDCSAIKCLFSMSVAKFLGKLQQLHIRGCPLMEAIVVDEQGTSTDGDNDIIINFSKLKSLRLENLPKLKSFYRENKDMHSSTQASILEHSGISPLLYQPLFDGMVAFPSLEELTIEHLEDTVSDIWGKCYYDDDNTVSSSFCKLKRLSVYNCVKLETVILLAMSRTLRNLEYLDIYVCSRLKNVFEHSFVARELIHLKTLEVDSCDIMRGIIGSGDEREQEITVDDDGIIVFPQLTVLKLFALPELSSFWCYQSTGEASSYKVQFPHLVDFELGYVEINMEDIGLGGELKRLCISCDNEIQLPYEWPLQLYNLEELKLKRCWHHQLKSLCFQRLKVLHVHNSGCSTLFTSSAFRSLQQLQKLEISNCASLEEIVEDVRDDEATGMDNKTITLVQLKTLILRDLPNLKSLIHGSKYECHMPALLKVEVHNCGLSTLFTCSVFRKLEQLKELKVSNCTLLEGIVEDARNDEINFTKGNIISVSQLSSVVLEDLPNLKRFSSTSSYSFNMPNLHEFGMRGCPLIEYFTFLKTSTRELLSVYSEWHQGEKIQDLNEYIRQIRKRGSSSSDSAGESSYIDQKLETKSERTDKEKPLEAEENDQP